MLYLFNRNALLEGFEVRMARAGDAEGVGALVAGMPNSEDIHSAFKGSQGVNRGYGGYGRVWGSQA